MRGECRGPITGTFDLNELLIALAYAIDLVEIDVLGTVSNHSRRVAYISLRTAENLGASREEIFDLVSLALLHDNGLAETTVRRDAGMSGPLDIDRIEGIKNHCVVGERIIEEAPFDGRHRTVILYHHENHDGSGYFGIPGSQVPLFSRVIHVADSIALATCGRSAGRPSRTCPGSSSAGADRGSRPRWSVPCRERCGAPRSGWTCGRSTSRPR